MDETRYATFDRELLAVHSAVRISVEARNSLFTLIINFWFERFVLLILKELVVEFTGDIPYIKDSENFTADAVSRITIDNVEYIRDGIDFKSVAAALKNDADLEYLVYPDKTSLKLEQFRISR